MPQNQPLPRGIQGKFTKLKKQEKEYPFDDQEGLDETMFYQVPHLRWLSETVIEYENITDSIDHYWQSVNVHLTLKTLTRRERLVLYGRFFLVRTLEQVGLDFGVCKERVRDLEGKALRKLRHPARVRLLRDACHPDLSLEKLTQELDEEYKTFKSECEDERLKYLKEKEAIKERQRQRNREYQERKKREAIEVEKHRKKTAKMREEMERRNKAWYAKQIQVQIEREEWIKKREEEELLSNEELVKRYKPIAEEEVRKYTWNPYTKQRIYHDD